jgi:outer membrane protein assembly factor BamB
MNRLWMRSALALCLSWATMGFAQEQPGWTRFRGPNGSGVDRSAELTTEFAKEVALWKVPLAGTGHSSPIVQGGQVFVTSFAAPDNHHLQAIDVATGKVAWEWTTKVAPHPLHQLNSIASSTPTTDGERVYCLIPQADNVRLCAIDLKGNLVWQRDLGRWTAQHGFGVSPILVGKNVIVPNSQEPYPNLPEPGKSEVIAVNAADGTDVWRMPIDGARACYGTPIVIKAADGQEKIILATTGEGFLSLDAASGRREWNENVFRLRIVGSPIVSGDSLLGNNGSGGGGNFVVNLKLGQNKQTVAYELHRAVGYVPTLIVLDDLLFSCTDNGMISCFDLASGRDHWAERISAGFWSSPISDGRHLFCVDKKGTVFVVKVSAKFEKPSSFALDETTEATPAIDNGRIFIRTAGNLFCFGKGPE